MIETERLRLREYTPDDFDALYEIMSDPETMQHYPAPFDAERTRNWITWNLENYEKYGFGLWAVVLKETGEFIGDCGITIQNIDGEMLPEIGYHIHKKYWRRGFAKEAARAVRDWVFRNTEYDTIYSYMKYTNIGSYSTAIANGMKKVKEYPDPKNTISYAYAITRAEWEALQGPDRREGNRTDRETEKKDILGKIAEAFLGAFSSMYIVNTDTNEYQWYSINAEFNSLEIEQTGRDFFADMAENVSKVIYEEDRHIFTENFRKETMLEGREKEIIYRLLIDGKPLYHSLRLIRGGIHGEDNYFILTVRNIDTEYRAQLEKQRLEEESALFNQVAVSLARVYDVIYYVNTVTNEYSEFSSTNLLDTLRKPAQGANFFEKLKGDAETVVYPQDREKVLAFLEKETLMSRLHSSALTSMEYRLQMGRQPVYVRLSGMLANDDVHVILCVENIDEEIRVLNEANEKARKDSLTGVRNKYAYFEEENMLQRKLDIGETKEFAVAVCDLNDLKITNDTLGHSTGDELIISACKLICETFKHSPVFRIGGDEFAIIMSGQDYENRDALMGTIRETSRAHKKEKAGVVVASGIALYDPQTDHTVADVFKRADQNMYENKKELKAPDR